MGPILWACLCTHTHTPVDTQAYYLQCSLHNLYGRACWRVSTKLSSSEACACKAKWIEGLEQQALNSPGFPRVMLCPCALLWDRGLVSFVGHCFTSTLKPLHCYISQNSPLDCKQSLHWCLARLASHTHTQTHTPLCNKHGLPVTPQQNISMTRSQLLNPNCVPSVFL